jgi:hypothetical protein
MGLLSRAQLVFITIWAYTQACNKMQLSRMLVSREKKEKRKEELNWCSSSITGHHFNISVQNNKEA